MGPPNLNGAVGKGKGHLSHLGAELVMGSARGREHGKAEGREAEADLEPLPLLTAGITGLPRWVLCRIKPRMLARQALHPLSYVATCIYSCSRIMAKLNLHIIYKVTSFHWACFGHSSTPLSARFRASEEHLGILFS